MQVLLDLLFQYFEKARDGGISHGALPRKRTGATLGQRGADRDHLQAGGFDPYMARY